MDSWTQPGAWADCDPINNVTISVANSGYTTQSFSLSPSMVQAWVSGTAANNGVLLRALTGVVSVYGGCCGNPQAKKPSLKVVYSTDGTTSVSPTAAPASPTRSPKAESSHAPAVHPSPAPQAPLPSLAPVILPVKIPTTAVPTKTPTTIPSTGAPSLAISCSPSADVSSVHGIELQEGRPLTTVNCIPANYQGTHLTSITTQYNDSWNYQNGK